METMVHVLFFVFLIASIIIAVVAPSPIIIGCSIVNALVIGFILAINYF